MSKTGLVSVTFRNLSCEEVIREAKKAGLSYLEWGSDIHVPPDNRAHAERIAHLTVENGLSISSYGTYYRLGEEQDFKSYLETAKILEAPVIRIWAGKHGSASVDPDTRKKLTAEAKEAAQAAAQYGIKVDFEYHPGTLTDESASALRLISEINEPNCGIYWQPDFFRSHKENRKAVSDVLEFLDIVHVFFLKPDYERLFLSEGEWLWKDYLDITRPKKDIKYLLEFVKEDKPEYLQREAITLEALLGDRNEIIHRNKKQQTV